MIAYDKAWDEQDPLKNHNTLLEGEEVLWRNAQWRVTNMFLEARADPAEIGPAYWITRASIEFDPHLVAHVCSKSWVDRDLFIEAHDKARELYGFGPSWDGRYEDHPSLAAKLLDGFAKADKVLDGAAGNITKILALFSDAELATFSERAAERWPATTGQHRFLHDLIHDEVARRAPDTTAR
jgi:hypothetical protein